MKKLFQLAMLALGFSLASGCAHNIKISPEMKPPASVQKSEKAVGYYIADSEKAKVTTTPGGGGDKVSYQSTKDMEYPLYQVLSEVYSSVKPLKSAASADVAKQEAVSLIFEPVFSSTSSGSSILIWPADKFSVSMSCKAYDGSGQLVFEKILTGNGTATNGELMSNFALAANRAAEDLLAQLRAELSSNAFLR